jgi:hypothetical protein
MSGNERRPLHAFRGFNMKLPIEPPLRPTHLPLRPSWACQTCGDEWPCAPARERLLQEKAADPTSIAVAMWQRLEEFALDQGSGPLPDAFDRFIGWTRR